MGKKKLTKGQKEFVRGNYKKVSVDKMAQKLGIERELVRQYVREVERITGSRGAREGLGRGKGEEISERKNEKKFNLIAIAIIFAVTFGIYANSLKNEFVYDDKTIIEENYFIKNWKLWKDLFTHNYFALSGERTYRPLVTLSFFIDYALWKLKPVGWHVTNILLHACNGILVFLLVSLILKNVETREQVEKGRWEQGSRSKNYKISPINYQPFFALATALLFVTHPVQTEAVNCVSFREDLMALFFFLISFLFYIKPQISQITTNNEKLTTKNLLLYTLSLLFFILALLSKESAVVLPLIIILYEFCFSSNATLKSKINNLKSTIGYFFILGVYIYLTRFSIFYNPGGRAEYPGGGLYTTFLTMSKAFAIYLKLLILPIRLCADYVIPISKSLLEPIVLLSIVILSGCFLAGILFYKRNKIITFSIFFLFISLLPVSNIIPFGGIMAERYLYMAMIGFCFIITIILNKIYILNSKNDKYSLLILLLLILIFYCYKTYERNKIWLNDSILWQETKRQSSP